MIEIDQSQMKSGSQMCAPYNLANTSNRVDISFIAFEIHT